MDTDDLSDAARSKSCDTSSQFGKILFDARRFNFKCLMILDTSNVVRQALEPSWTSREDILQLFPKNRRVFFRTDGGSCVGIGIVKGIGLGQRTKNPWSVLIEPLETIQVHGPKSIYYDEDIYPVFCVDLKEDCRVSNTEVVCIIPLL